MIAGFWFFILQDGLFKKTLIMFGDKYIYLRKKMMYHKRICFLTLVFMSFVCKVSAQDYAPSPYYDSQIVSLWVSENLNPFDSDFIIKANIFWSGPSVYLSEYTYKVGSSNINGDVSYVINRKTSSIVDNPQVIYFCKIYGCSSYLRPCDDVSHSPKTPDWASRVSITCLYWMTVTMKQSVLGFVKTTYHNANGVGMSSYSRSYYDGISFN